MSDSTTSVAVPPDVFKEKVDALVEIAGELSEDAHGSPAMLYQGAVLLNIAAGLVSEGNAEALWCNGA